MSVQSVTVGAATATSIGVVAVVSSTAPVRIAYSTQQSMASPQYTDSVAPTAVEVYSTTGAVTEYVARATVASLDPNTRYYIRIDHDGQLDTAYPATARTLPVPGSHASFTLGTVGDAGLSPAAPGVGDILAPDRMSNHEFFSTLAAKAIADDWLMLAHLGDLCYYDPGRSTGQGDMPGGVAGCTPAVYRRMFTDVWRQPTQHQLYRSVSTLFLPDDHDRGHNDHDRTHPGGPSYEAVYRERLPHYPLSDPGGTWQAILIGRVLVIASDCRHGRDPNTDPDSPSKTMLGDAQVAWLEGLFDTGAAAAGAEAIVWLMPGQWLRTDGEDTWAIFSFEREWLAQLVTDTGWADRVAMVNADRHALKIMETQPWGGWPTMVCTPLDAAGGSGNYDYPDGLPDEPGESHSQYGTVAVEDVGERITITLTTWQPDGMVGETSLVIPIQAPPPRAPGAFARTLTGSHRLHVDARVVTDYYTSHDPVGITIPVLDGDIQLDGTANIRGTLSLTTVGQWPRRASDLLAPYGNEIFVRVGIDAGNTIDWVPLGYYRIESPEQDDPPHGPIRIGASDRMASIADSRVPVPVEFDQSVRVAAMFHALVNDVYPDAVIVFDDDTGAARLGRNILVEEDRLAALTDVVASRGKIMYWDGAGFLRVVSAPDETQPVWEVAAGRDGVMVEASRRLTRDGVYNAVVATGEGTDDQSPVHAIAVDNGATSPTRWGGRFGKVPRFYASPMITTTDQATSAAHAMLRRHLGAPYSVDFGSVSNPSLEPGDPVRVAHSDGTREIHVIERLSIPLSPESHMTASTREKTLVVVKGLI